MNESLAMERLGNEWNERVIEMDQRLSDSVRRNKHANEQVCNMGTIGCNCITGLLETLE